MNYRYTIESHNSEDKTLLVKVSCLDVAGYSGVIPIPYPTSLGVPDFEDRRVDEQIKLYFKGDLYNWGSQEKNKGQASSIKSQADALVGKAKKICRKKKW
jgi:hypothetical protein